jgi:hypothetical protein
MQKSTVKGSQGGSGVDVIDGVTDETGVGDGTVAVAMTCVFTTMVGVSGTGAFTQDTRINSKRAANVCFIR